MFPQRSIYRPVNGMGEYFSAMNGPNAMGAYFKPMYEKPIAGLGGGCGCRGVGASALTDNTVMTPQVSTANKTNAALLIGLGVAVIIGGVIFLGPHR